MHMVAGSWTECAKYSIERKKIEKNLKVVTDCTSRP